LIRESSFLQYDWTGKKKTLGLKENSTFSSKSSKLRTSFSKGYEGL
jgi:hypothetical protein